MSLILPRVVSRPLKLPDSVARFKHRVDFYEYQLAGRSRDSFARTKLEPRRAYSAIVRSAFSERFLTRLPSVIAE